MCCCITRADIGTGTGIESYSSSSSVVVVIVLLRQWWYRLQLKHRYAFETWQIHCQFLLIRFAFGCKSSLLQTAGSTESKLIGASIISLFPFCLFPAFKKQFVIVTGLTCFYAKTLLSIASLIVITNGSKSLSIISIRYLLTPLW